MTSRTILLIDDDTDLLQAVAQRCRSVGLGVQHARNLLTATNMIERYVPDLICIDVEMPTGNGLRFCDVLRMEPRTAHVPIIVLTGRKDPETIRKCDEIGAHYLFKSAETWAGLEPLIARLVDAPKNRPRRTTTGIRPRNLPAHSIPPWPEEAGAGNHSATESHHGGTDMSAGSDTPRYVIVADDDNDLVQMLSERFESLGCRVIGVNTALDAVNTIHQVRPDLVVLDVNMPTGSGLSVCEMMAADEKLRMVPVIILTGCSDESTIRRCHDMLVFYVQKGADIWSRIDPLVRELLHLGDAPEANEMASALKTAVPEEAHAALPNAPSTARDKSGETAEQSQSDELMDAVFAMLGADAGMKAVAESEAIELPWILCIDDDFDFSDALKLRFDEYGVAVARAANGMDGFCMAFSTPARAILLDYQMPNGQGDYILDRLKSNPVTRDIPVYMITGVKDKMLERRVMAMGAAGYLLKPVDFERLRAELSRYISALDTRDRRTSMARAATY